MYLAAFFHVWSVKYLRLSSYRGLYCCTWSYLDSGVGTLSPYYRPTYLQCFSSWTSLRHPPVPWVIDMDTLSTTQVRSSSNPTPLEAYLLWSAILFWRQQKACWSVYFTGLNIWVQLIINVGTALERKLTYSLCDQLTCVAKNLSSVHSAGGLFLLVPTCCSALRQYPMDVIPALLVWSSIYPMSLELYFVWKPFGR